MAAGDRRRARMGRRVQQARGESRVFSDLPCWVSRRRAEREARRAARAGDEEDADRFLAALAEELSVRG